MPPSPSHPLIAVDIGNSRIKFGLFSGQGANAGLPEPERTFDIQPQIDPLDGLESWLGAEGVTNVSWWIGSVHRRAASRLVDWLRDHGAQDITLLASVDLPLVISLPRPDMVGIDRLLGAMAANRLRPANTAAVVVDLGTAITVDMVSAEGAFLGGAILPGIGLASRALHEFTDLLPLMDMQSLAEPPAPLGTNTVEAMKSGIYWGAVGGVRHLIGLLSAGVSPAPRVFLTGGAAPSVAKLISTEAVYVPNLVLSGIALAAQK